MQPPREKVGEVMLAAPRSRAPGRPVGCPIARQPIAASRSFSYCTYGRFRPVLAPRAPPIAPHKRHQQREDARSSQYRAQILRSIVRSVGERHAAKIIQEAKT